MIDGMTTHYGKETVLDDISLSIADNEIFGLIGLNGVGKTTLMKSILSLVRPTAGSVRIFGEDHVDPASRARLAFLPEKFQPPPLLTGAEFIRFSLSSYGLGRRRCPSGSGRTRLSSPFPAKFSKASRRRPWPVTARR